MGWQEVGLSAGGQDYIKVKAGQKVKVHVLSAEPYTFFQHFFNTIQRSAVCPGDGCPACAANDKDMRKRTQHSFVVADEEGNVKVWNMGNETAEKVKNIYDTYESSLDSVDLVVNRTGTGKDTSYGVTPVAAKIDVSSVDMEALPNLEEIHAPASAEDIEKMMAGIDPAQEFDPSKLEAASEGPTPVEDAPAEEEAPPKPAPKPVAKATPNGDPKQPVIQQIMKLLSTSVKYKAMPARQSLFKRCAPGKGTVSAMTLQELIRVRGELLKK